MSRFERAGTPTPHADGDGGKESTKPALTMPATGIDPDGASE